MAAADRKFIKPGRWHEEFDENGNVVKVVYEESLRMLLGYETEAEFANTDEAWENSLHPEDAERVKKVFAEVIKKHPEGMDYDAEYRLLTKTGYRWFHDYADFTRREDGSPVSCEGVIFDIDEAVRLAERKKNKTIAEQSVFTSFFLEPYQSAYYVGLDDLSMTVYKRTAELDKNYPDTTNYLDSLHEYIEREVHPDDRAGLAELIRPEKLKELLAGQPEFSYTYRLLKDDAEQYIRFQVIRGADENHAALGFKDITAEVHEEQEQKRQLEEALEKAVIERQRNDFLYDIMNASKWSSDISAEDEITETHYSEGVYQQTHTRPEGEAMSWTEFIHPEDKDRVTEAFMAAVKDRSGRTKYDVTFRLLGDDGKARWIKTAGRTARRGDGSGEIYGMNIDLTEQIEKERENIRRMLALEDEFEALYDVELDTGRYAVFIKGKSFSAEVQDRLEKAGDYFADLRENVPAVVYPDDQQELFELLTPERLRRALAQQAQLDHYYRVMIDKEPVWFKIRAVYKDTARKNVIIGVFNAAAEVAAREQTEQARNELIAQMTSGESLYIINPETKRFRILSQNEYLAGNYTEAESFAESFTRYIKTDVFESDREMVTKAISLTAMVRQLKKNKEYVVQYRDISTGTPRWYEMRAMKLSRSEILCSFTDKDTEIILQHLDEAERAENVAVLAVDLDSATLKVIKKNPWDTAYEEGEVIPYSEFASRIGGKYAGEVKAFYEKIGDAEKLRAILAQDYKHTFSYRSEFVEGDKWINLSGYVVARNEDGSPAAAVLCYSLLDTLGSDRAEMQEKIEESLTFTNYFLGTYISAYYIGLEDLSCQVYKRTAELEKNFPITTNYLDAINERIEAVVHPEDKAELEKLVRPENIRKTLQAKKEIVYSFRVNSSEGEKIYRLQIIRGADENHAAMGFVDITEELRKETDTRLQQELIKQMTGQEGLFIIDCVKDTRRTVHDRTYGAEYYSDDVRYSEEVGRYIDNFVSEADQEMMREATSLSYMLERAKKEGEYTVEYREWSTGVQRFYGMKIVRFSDTEVLQSFAANDKEFVDRVLLQSLKNEYFGLYGLELDGGLAQTIKKIPWYDTGAERDIFAYPAAMKEFARSFDGEVRAYFEKVSDIEYLKQRFAKEDRSTFNFKTDRLEGDKWVNVTWHIVGRHKDGTPSIAIFGFNILDSDATERRELLDKVRKALAETEEANRVISEQSAFTSFFLDSYEAAYYIGLDDLSLKVYKQSDAAKESYSFDEKNYVELFNEHIKREVHRDDRQRLAEIIRPEKMKELLAEQAEYSYTFRIIKDGDERYARIQIIRGVNEAHAVLGFKDITEEVRQQRQQQKNDELIGSFAHDYIAAFMVDLTDDSYVDVSGRDELFRQMTDVSTFSEKVKKYVMQYAHPDDHEAFNIFKFSPENVRKELPLGKMVSIEYRNNYKTGDYLWYRVALTRLSENAVLVGFKDCDEEILSRFVNEKLLGKFDALYYVDLNEDTIRPVHYTSRASMVGSFTEVKRYGMMVRRFAGTVAPKYEQDWLNFSDAAYMKKYMAETDQREYIYELPEMDQKLRRCTIDVIHRIDGEAATLLMAFEGIDDVRAQTILLHQKMAEQYVLIDGLAREYHTVYLMEGTGEHRIHLVGTTGKKTIKSALRLAKEEPRYDIGIVKYVCDNVYEDDRERVLEAVKFETVARETANGKYYVVTFRRHFRDYESFDYHQMCYAQAVADDGTVNYIFAYRDVDEVIRAQVEKERAQQVRLEEALALAESASRAKSTFLFNMSHDIRTPMNAILGYTDVALRHFDDAERAKDGLRKIKSSGEHLLSLINDILEMSRIESGKLEIKEEPLDIHAAIENISLMSEALAVPKSIKFAVNKGEIKNPYIYADELHVNEVLINIISNAMKYSYEDGNVSYTVCQLGEAEDGKAWYRFEIADDGIGMSTEFQKHIFESFTREKSSTVSKQEGAGLGMAIVKRIVDLLEGEIAINSKLGHGTTVTIDIPFRVMDEAAIEEFAAEQADENKAGGDVVLTGKKVLLVEDNEMNREIAEEILKDAGLLVETAEDGDIAVRIFGEKGSGYYDFVLMDIQMPTMNGYDATRAIRKLPGGDIVPIIALSANAFAEDKQKSFEAGMNEHIAKPIDVQELFETLKKAAGR